MRYEFVTVDFDGTLCENAFPDIGPPNRKIVSYVKRLAAEGSKIILRTRREDGPRKLLTEAVRFCEDQGIPLFAVKGDRDRAGHAIPPPDDFRIARANLYIGGSACYPEDLRHDGESANAEERKAGGLKAVCQMTQGAALWFVHAPNCPTVPVHAPDRRSAVEAAAKMLFVPPDRLSGQCGAERWEVV